MATFITTAVRTSIPTHFTLIFTKISKTIQIASSPPQILIIVKSIYRYMRTDGLHWRMFLQVARCRSVKTNEMWTLYTACRGWYHYTGSYLSTIAVCDVAPAYPEPRSQHKPVLGFHLCHEFEFNKELNNHMVSEHLMKKVPASGM
jgi:hypothetical protein